MTLSVRKAKKEDIPTISRLADETWWPTYRDIISEAQITFMLEDMYSEGSLKKQMESGVTFLLAERESKPVGFAGFSGTAQHIFKLHKPYVLPSEQGKGTGKALINKVSTIARASGGEILELNVNRGNRASEFYKKQGFEIFQTPDIPYHSFILNDYVMRLEL